MEEYRRYRWAGRLTGFLGIVYFVSFFIGQGYEAFHEADAAHDILFVLTLFSFALIANVVGWLVEIVGGALLSLIGIAMPFYLAFTPVFEGVGTLLTFSLPFLTPGVLFLIAWRIKVLRKIRQNQKAG